MRYVFLPQTDPKSSDYIMEHGATRNFESLRRLQEKIARENKEDEEEEIANPMKVSYIILLN